MVTGVTATGPPGTAWATGQLTQGNQQEQLDSWAIVIEVTVQLLAGTGLAPPVSEGEAEERLCLYME
jgi:hypothetical protein